MKDIAGGKKEKTFQIQGIAWSKRNSYLPIHPDSPPINGVKVNINEVCEQWGESLSFEVENSTKTTQTLKIFFLIEWLGCKEDTIGVLSLSQDTFWNYSGNHIAITNIVSSAESIKKSIYPLNLKGLQLWKKSLDKGSLFYYPITNGLNMMIYMLDFTLKPFEVKQGKVYAIEGNLKEDVLNLSNRIKNGLAFPSKK